MERESGKDKVKRLWKKEWVRNAVFFALLALVFLTDIPLWVNIQITKFRLDSDAQIEMREEPSPSVYHFDVKIENTEGAPVKLSDFEGNYVLVNFWASWCVPCLAEFPSLEAVKEQFPDLNMVFINLEDREAFDRFVDKTEVDLPFYRLAGPIPKILAHQSIPTTFILNEDGQVVISHYSAIDWSSPEVTEQLSALLND